MHLGKCLLAVKWKQKGQQGNPSIRHHKQTPVCNIIILPILLYLLYSWQILSNTINSDKGDAIELHLPHYCHKAIKYGSGGSNVIYSRALCFLFEAVLLYSSPHIETRIMPKSEVSLRSPRVCGSSQTQFYRSCRVN